MAKKVPASPFRSSYLVEVQTPPFKGWDQAGRHFATAGHDFIDVRNSLTEAEARARSNALRKLEDSHVLVQTGGTARGTRWKLFEREPNGSPGKELTGRGLDELKKRKSPASGKRGPKYRGGATIGAAQKRRIVADAERKALREALAKIRADLRKLRDQERNEQRKARESCRRGRAKLNAIIRARRARLREWFNAEVKKARAEYRERCAVKRQAIRARYKSQAEAKRAEAQQRRKTSADIRSTEARLRREEKRRSASEARAESDDLVRSNVPADLAPVWDAVKGRIKAKRGMSRTEAFLHWAEENPGEVVNILHGQAERSTARRIRELEKLEREMAREAKKQTKPSKRTVRKAQDAGYAPPELHDDLLSWLEGA